jgi:O-antigen ligase
MEISLKQKLFYFFPVLFCFCLPFGSIVLSALVVAWVLISFFNLNKVDFINGIRNKKLILFYSFFFITVLSALFSSNVSEAGFSIEVKLTFFIFPYLFFCFKWPSSILKRCVISFVSGCFFACVYLIGRAFLYTLDGQPDYFFYSLFSDFIHASYFAMYLILAIVFVVLLYNNWFKTQKSVIYSSYFFVSIFITSIFLCSSKLGMISFFISMPLLFLYKFKEKLNGKIILAICFSMVVLFLALIKVAPQSFNRFNSLSSASLQNVDKTSSESTTVRILIWKEALVLIKNNFLFGTGVGDANDNLYNSYEQNGLTGALEHKFNAHNQFLQTFIGMGLTGFAVLLAITLGSLINAILKKHFLLFIFSLIIILNFMVESMLQTSAGVLFFAFFACFFEKVNESDLLKKESFNVPENIIKP